jgi:hypothetical protein
MMDESELTKVFKTLSERPIPNLPSDFKSSLWRRIRLSGAAVRESWLDLFVSALLRPAWAAVALIITLAIGANLGRTFAAAEAAQNHKYLGLNVFSGDAPALPSTLLNRFR